MSGIYVCPVTKAACEKWACRRDGCEKVVDDSSKQPEDKLPPPAASDGVKK